MNLTIVDEIMKRLDDGYHQENGGAAGYPPFALTSWDDRNSYRAYVRRTLDLFFLGVVNEQAGKP